MLSKNLNATPPQKKKESQIEDIRNYERKPKLEI